MTDPRLTRAGALLYRHLPEEYRYRDGLSRKTGELADLEAYLHAFGDLLDRLRATLEQSYADSFAMEDDRGGTAQTWMLPYTAALLGTRLRAPDLDGTGTIRRRELNRAVAWSKGKGTLQVADDVADVLAGAETVVVEGWRRTAITPRLGLPPFTLSGGPTAPDQMPLGTPDLRRMTRAVIDPAGRDPIRRFDVSLRDAFGLSTQDTVHWRPLARAGAPCFPGSFDDTTVRTPDLRSRAAPGTGQPARLGPAPRRVAVHVAPPVGFFDAGVRALALTEARLRSFLAARAAAGDPVRTLGPAEAMAAMNAQGPVPDRVNLTRPLGLDPGQELGFRDVNMTETLTLREGSRARLSAVAVRRVRMGAPGETKGPALTAQDTLIDEVFGPAAFAQLDYVTVLGATTLARLHASDCIFVGPLTDAVCLARASCIRYSRVPPALAQVMIPGPDENDPPHPCPFAGARSNTTRPVRFAARPLPGPDGGACIIAIPGFGQPGAGVLASDADPAIVAGAEDGTEMGAYHGRGHAARLAAMATRLTDQLPIGQALDVFHDPLLAVRPPRLRPAG